ncbi:MAG: Short chain enoyl-CoA hydratase [Ramlibacter sp.]|nr:Short chain enoyl-CoA hydratase [Ramlibacter sp.]
MMEPSSLDRAEPDLRVECDRGIAVVRFDRPPVNAFTRSMYDQLRRTFHRLAEMDDLRVIVLTGTGRVFCGGNEISEFVDLGYEEATEHLAHVRLCFNAIYDCPVPVIGAINGAAIGTGMALATLCDIRIAADTAVFALPEIDVGVLGGSKHVMRIAPQGLTRLMMFTGRRVSAAQALAASMIEEAVPPAQVLPRARELAEEIASKSPKAIRFAKVGLNRTENMTLKEGYEFECTLTAAVRRTAEAREGALAFIEKRKPSYALDR